jgi:response regulator RpfG family c-di-GMP phosphodiesterase
MARIANLWIIDDDPMTSFYIKRLAELGQLASIITIYDQARGAADYLLDHYKSPEHLPDYILLDIYMPELDGWGFLEEFALIRDKLIKKVEICIITSSNHLHDRERAEALKFIKTYVQKPITLEALKEIVS